MMENYKLISVNILTNFSRSGLSRLIFNYTLNSIYIEEFYEHTNMFDEEFQLIYYGIPKVIIYLNSYEALQYNSPYFSKYSICKYILGM